MSAVMFDVIPYFALNPKSPFTFSFSNLESEFVLSEIAPD